MLSVFLFIFGAAIGSFLNIAASRYDPGRGVFSLKSIGGRSHCPKCSHQLAWFDLIPLASFLYLFGKCRYCRGKISLQYPAVEIVAGFIFLLPLYFYERFQIASALALGEPLLWYYALAAIWVMALYVLLVLSLIDLRLYIIPDSVNVFLGILGIFKAVSLYFFYKFDLVAGTFLGNYALLFGLRENVFVNHALAALIGAAVFGIIIYVTRGKGMGMGDLKLAAALGLLLGWPDILLVVTLSFILGSLYGIPGLIRGKYTMKDAVPFGPFMVLGAVATMFFGHKLLELYFTAFNL